MTTVLRAVCAAVAFVSVAFVAPSLQTYYGNGADTGFRSTFVDTGYGLIALASFALAVALPLLSPGRVRPFVIAGVLGFGTCALVQQIVFAGGFGPVDGTPFDFQALSMRLSLEGAVWILVLGGTLLVGREVASRSVFLSALLVAWTALSGLQVVWRANHIEMTAPASSATTFAFSKQRNVVFWISDALQGDITEQILRDDVVLRDTLKGFTYYPDATSHYKFTVFSIPTLLTGRLGDAYRSVEEYSQEVRNGGNLSRTLKHAGYDINMVSTQEFCVAFDTCDFYWSLVRPPRVVSPARAQLMSLALFRVTPGPLKSLVFDGVSGMGTWLANDTAVRGNISGRAGGELQRKLALSQTPPQDVYFFKRLIERMNATAERPTFKVFHSRGSHAPYLLRPDCSVNEIRSTDDAIVEQSKCQIAVFASFIQRLKSLGVYDNTTIVWVSDHGARAKRRGSDGNLAHAYQADASATFAIKFAGAEHGFRFSDQAVQLVDAVPTVLQELGMKSDGYDGHALQTLTDTQRARYFVDHKTYSRNSRVLFDRYEIVGRRDNESSWARLGISTFAHANTFSRER